MKKFIAGSFLLFAVLITLETNAQLHMRDKLNFAYIPPENVEMVKASFDSMYARHGIKLPELTDTVGWLQIRMISNTRDMIWDLYKKLPPLWGDPVKGEAVYKWNELSLPEVHDSSLTITYIFFGVSSYLSNRGTSVSAQLIWISVQDDHGNDLMATNNITYVRLKDYLKGLLQHR
ncbi:MAG: hypothetical protein IH946_00525 [Bacteroidetes bacterium]|nr:hypothetical protein [Bacteroidota bacterium]